MASPMPLMLPSAPYVAVGVPYFYHTYTQTDVQHTYHFLCWLLFGNRISLFVSIVLGVVQ